MIFDSGAFAYSQFFPCCSSPLISDNSHCAAEVLQPSALFKTERERGRERERERERKWGGMGSQRRYTAQAMNFH